MHKLTKTVEDIWSNLCSTYSASFEPFKNKFPTSLQVPFTSWADVFHDQQRSRARIGDELRMCTQDPQEACTSEWYMMLNPTLKKTTAMTMGCVRSTVSMAPPCSASGSYELESGSITSYAASVCGAKIISHILITTDVPRSTSTSSSPHEGNKATTSAVPSAPTAGTTGRVSSQSSGTTMNNGVTGHTNAPLKPSATTGSDDSSKTTNFRQSGNTQSATRDLSNTSKQSNSKGSASGSPTATQTSAAIVGDPNTNFTLAAHEVIVGRPFTYSTYFAATFLPALIAVVLKTLWSIIASSLRMIEPFQRLMEGKNVTAKYSLMTQYLEGTISGDIIQSLIRGRMLPTCSLLIYAMVEILPLMGAISMSVKTRRKCEYEGEYRPCDPVWVLDLPLVRALEALLFFCIALVIFLIWLTRRSDIPVSSNPSSIVSLAALLNYEPFLLGLQRIDPDADAKLIGTALTRRVYYMAEHYDPKSKQTRFGFVSSQITGSPDDRHYSKPYQFSSHGEKNIAYTPVGNPGYVVEQQTTAHRSRLSPISRLWTKTVMHLLTTSGLLAIVVTYMLDTNLDDAFNRFFNGDSVPPVVSKTVFVGLAILVDMQMKSLERTIRITDPFRRLALRNARAETTILLTLNGTCWSNLPRNLYLLCRYETSQGRMAWVTFVSFVACLSDANIVAVAGFLFNDAQTREAYYTCGYLCMVCTSAILLTVLITMGWWLRVPVIRRMPRQPDTIGNMLSYLCGSEIVKDLNDLNEFSTPVENLSRRERDALVVQGGRRFCFGRMLGMDERERWSIDYEREQSQVMIVPKSY